VPKRLGEFPRRQSIVAEIASARDRLRMPLEIAFVPGRHTERQAIGDLSRDFLRDAGGWAATVMALGGLRERTADAAELNGSDFDAPSTDFNRVHLELPKRKAA
jgi:hypothetical protein